MSQEILKAYKYRLYPNVGQKIFLAKTFGCGRFLWNQRVDQFNKNDGSKEPTIKELKQKYEWLGEVPYDALMNKNHDWIGFKSQFFNKKRKKKLGRPNFKKRGGRESFRLCSFPNQVRKLKFLEINQIKLPKMSPVKIKIDRKFVGEIRSVTISKTSSNQYFISILVKEKVQLKKSTGKSIGIDLGIKDLITLSNGFKIENPKWFRENQAELKKAQQHLSRKKKGSKRREKQRLKVTKIHQKITNQRQWFHHNISKWLVDNYDLIFTEDLNIEGMMKNHNLSKSISDASWSTLVSMIEYKSNWSGRTHHKIDRWFPSSKTCSCCGHKMESMDLSIRNWTCPSCQTKHDRDMNAANNILNKGLMDLYSFTSEECPDHSCGEEISLDGIHPIIASSMRRLETVDV
ncbi:MAG: transposase [Candidatus Peribacteraceae bacterium]|nr:transposase [Candidatus Peribacteraceae bacterium]